MNVLNVFKGEAPYLLPTLARDGGKMVLLSELEPESYKSRLETDMIKLKL